MDRRTFFRSCGAAVVAPLGLSVAPAESEPDAPAELMVGQIARVPGSWVEITALAVRPMNAGEALGRLGPGEYGRRIREEWEVYGGRKTD